MQLISSSDRPENKQIVFRNLHNKTAENKNFKKSDKVMVTSVKILTSINFYSLQLQLSKHNKEKTDN
jgi:hypothetical protein